MNYRRLWLLLLALALSGSVGIGCLPTAPGRLSLNPPARPVKRGKFDIGLSGGATVLGGFFVGNLWFRYGLIDPLALEIAGFYMNPLVGGGNLALRWTAVDKRIFHLELVPGVGLGSHIDIGAAFHVSPNLGLVGSFKLGPHSLYLGLHSSVAITPNGHFVTTLYNSGAIGAVFTIAKHYHIHIEAMGTWLYAPHSGASVFFGVPTLGFFGFVLSRCSRVAPALYSDQPNQLSHVSQRALRLGGQL